MAFITFEGIDGSGKSTVAKMLAEELEKDGKKVFFTREPTENWIGQQIRDADKKEVPIVVEALLFAADRDLHTSEIEEHLGKGEFVICDRYRDSSLAYQGPKLADSMGLDDALEWIFEINWPASMDPGLTFLFQIEPAMGLKRVAGRGEKSKFEKEQYLASVQEVYMMLAENEPERFRVIDASRPLDVVSAEVNTIVRKLFK